MNPTSHVPPRYVSIPVQYGDSLGWIPLRPIKLALLNRMFEHLHGPHSPEVDELSFVFRVGGFIQTFNFEGIERLRRSKAKRYITVDVGVPEYLWRSKTREELGRYLADCIEQGLLAFIAKLKKDKAPIEGERLMREWEAAKQAFLEDVDTNNLPEGLKWPGKQSEQPGVEDAR
jgi:hypothetical protein